MEARTLSKTEKAAILFLCMDEKATSGIFNKLDDEEIRKVGNAMLGLSRIPAAQIQSVMEEFYSQVDNGPIGSPDDVRLDGKVAAQKLLSKSLDGGRRDKILPTIGKKILPTVDDISQFSQMVDGNSAEDLLDILKQEHPQLIALVLSYARKTLSRDVIRALPEDVQVNVVGRIARLEKVSGILLDEVRQFLVEKIQERVKESNGVSKVQSTLSLEGMESAISLLKTLKREQSSFILEGIEAADPELGAVISRRIFTMEDLIRADSRGMQELMRGIPNDTLKKALKTVEEAVQEKFFAAMSQRAASILRDDMSVLTGLKPEEIEAAQDEILKTAKALIKEEKMVLADAGGDGE